MWLYWQARPSIHLTFKIRECFFQLMNTQPGRCFSLSPWAIQTIVQESFPGWVQCPTCECPCVMSELGNNLQKPLSANFTSREDWDLFEIQCCTDILLAACTVWFPRSLLFLESSWSFSFTDIPVKNCSYMEQCKPFFATASLQFSRMSIYKKWDGLHCFLVWFIWCKDSFKAVVWWGKW